jgi:hypothetical protein
MFFDPQIYTTEELDSLLKKLEENPLFMRVEEAARKAALVDLHSRIAESLVQKELDLLVENQKPKRKPRAKKAATL